MIGSILTKLFNEIGPRFATRPGGYTRIIKRHERRLGDGGKTAFLELLKEGETKPKKERPAAPAPRVETPPAPAPETPACPRAGTGRPAAAGSADSRNANQSTDGARRLIRLLGERPA